MRHPNWNHLKIKALTCLPVLLLLTALPRYSESQTIHFDLDPKKSEVQFTSDAPLDRVIGRTKNIKGWIKIDVKNTLKTKGFISVNPSSLNTGNRLRDRQMRERFLQTDKYPEVTFSLERVISGPRNLRNSEVGSFNVEGVFDLHGVKRREKATLTARLNKEGSTLEIDGHFTLILADYKIERPQFLMLRLSEKVDVKLNLIFR